MDNIYIEVVNLLLFILPVVIGLWLGYRLNQKVKNISNKMDGDVHPMAMSSSELEQVINNPDTPEDVKQYCQNIYERKYYTRTRKVRQPEDTRVPDDLPSDDHQ